jgi:hypothetical protein
LNEQAVYWCGMVGGMISTAIRPPANNSPYYAMMRLIMISPGTSRSFLSTGITHVSC